MKILTKLVAATLSLAAFTSTAHAEVNGTTNLNVNIPNILVLYHWDKVDLNFNDIDKALKQENLVIENQELGDVSVDTNILTPLDNLPFATDNSLNNVNVKLSNAWAVRNITKGGASLSLSSNNTLKSDDETSVITLTDVSINQSNVDNNNVDKKTLILGSKWEPTIGDLNFKMNMGGVTKAGLHTTRQANTSTFTFNLTAIQESL